MNAIRIAALLLISCCMNCNDDGDRWAVQVGSEQSVVSSFLVVESESYGSSVGEVRIESNVNASEGLCVHLGPDSDVESEGVGEALVYSVEVPCDFSNCVFEICYADDVGGNIVHLFVDGVNRGCFRTETTGGWSEFGTDCQRIIIGQLSESTHSVRLEMSTGGSWGVLLDFFRISRADTIEPVSGYYAFVKSLVSDVTGLVRSAEYDSGFTTVYKNALAAMAFIHEGDLELAKGIFDFFASKYDEATFEGFNKNWDAQTGIELEKDHWVGDNAFLMLALNYYVQATGSYAPYDDMASGLVDWLAEMAYEDTDAEGVANMYSALEPFACTVPGVDAALAKLEADFQAKKEYNNVLDHIERGALCFEDLSGFDYVGTFTRTEYWEYDNQQISLLSAFSWDDYCNTEITAQILLAWRIWEADLSVDLSNLETEINRLWLLGADAPATMSCGLPYYLTYDPTQDVGHGWPGCYFQPIVDPVCYMLFYYWRFNPMAPEVPSAS